MFRSVHAMAACLLALFATPSAAEDGPGQRTEAEIAAMPLDKLQNAVAQNTAIMQLYYEELSRRNPGKMPPLKQTIPGLKIDPKELAGLTDQNLMTVFETLSGENDRLVAQSEKLLAANGRSTAPGTRAPTPAPAARARDSVAPAKLNGRWQCMRSVVTASSMYQPMLTFTLQPGTWTDLTFGPARALKGKATYANGDLKLYSAKGSLLHTLRWTPAGDGGASERLVEVLGADDTSRAGEVCYAGSGSAADAE